MADLFVATADVFNDSTPTITVQAGEIVDEGEVVYLSSGKYYLTDCDDAAKDDPAGIALTGAALDGWFILATGGSITLGATMTVGEVYVVSGTPGKIAPYSDLSTNDYVTILFVAETATKATINNIYTTEVQIP